MRDSRPQSLDTLFNDNSAGALRNVQQRAVALLKLNRAVKALLPAPLQPWCRVANFRQGILILETGNASWMMRLRYEQSSLLSALRAEILPSLAAIDIRINPSLMAEMAIKTAKEEINQEVMADPAHPARKLSAESAAQLESLAERSPEKLKAKLKRLAALAGERDTNETSRNKKR